MPLGVTGFVLTSFWEPGEYLFVFCCKMLGAMFVGSVSSTGVGNVSCFGLLLVWCGMVWYGVMWCGMVLCCWCFVLLCLCYD